MFLTSSIVLYCLRPSDTALPSARHEHALSCTSSRPNFHIDDCFNKILRYWEVWLCFSYYNTSVSSSTLTPKKFFKRLNYKILTIIIFFVLLMKLYMKSWGWFVFLSMLGATHPHVKAFEQQHVNANHSRALASLVENK